MKTEAKIRAKIKEHEILIKKMLKVKLDDESVHQIEIYLARREAWLWWLSDDEFVQPDEFEKKVNWEITCYESTKIF
jgi:hypothetical protein